LYVFFFKFTFFLCVLFFFFLLCFFYAGTDFRVFPVLAKLTVNEKLLKPNGM